MGLIKKLFGGQTNQLVTYINNDAVIIDVRSASEFSEGSVKGAKNIPLHSIDERINEIIKLDKPIVLCCASGMRSGKATKMLQQNGVDCLNGGGWTKVQKVVSRL